MSSHLSFSKASMTSLPCTSIVTNAPKVNLSKSVNYCLTKITISFSSATNCTWNYLIVLFWMACSAKSVHLIILTAKTVCAGHFLTHFTLSVVSEMASLVIFLRVEIMTPSISESHLSTFPFFSPSFTSTPFKNGTFYFSAEIIPTTCCWGVNYNCAIASKHLLMCFWTVRGSLVWAKISNNSSSDKKKNRGKNLLLVSRYSDKDFWISSRSLLLFSKSNLYLSVSIPSHKLDSLLNWSKMLLQLLSTVSNLVFYVCILALISSDEKIGSKYIHPLWVLIHPSRVSWIRIILVSIRLAFCKIGLIAGLALHINRMFNWSSRDCWTSSTPFNTKVPVVL